MVDRVPSLNVAFSLHVASMNELQRQHVLDVIARIRRRLSDYRKGVRYVVDGCDQTTQRIAQQKCLARFCFALLRRHRARVHNGGWRRQG
jgi:hypothetical protein